MPCHLVVFVVVHSFNYVDLSGLWVDVRGVSDSAKRNSHSAMFHFQESKMQARRLVVENRHLADHPSGQLQHTTAPWRIVYIQNEEARVIDLVAGNSDTD
jgi:hypothetical protein